jgi:mannosyltransferase OCH1-like enzyme
MTQFLVKLTDTWKTKNPRWEHILWHKENAYSFLKENFPNWLSFHEQLTHNVQSFDLSKIFIID